jgi:hypothetical protein
VWLFLFFREKRVQSRQRGRGNVTSLRGLEEGGGEGFWVDPPVVMLVGGFGGVVGGVGGHVGVVLLRLGIILGVDGCTFGVTWKVWEIAMCERWSALATSGSWHLCEL